MAELCAADDTQEQLRERIQEKLDVARAEEEELRSKLYMGWAPDIVKSNETKETEVNSRASPTAPRPSPGPHRFGRDLACRARLQESSF